MKIKFKDQIYDNTHDLFLRLESEGYLEITRIKIYKAEDKLLGTNNECTNQDILDKLLEVYPDELIKEEED